MKLSKLTLWEQSGDWHDKPLRYQVTGPGNEIQKFSTKRDAVRYSKLRLKQVNQSDAIKAYVT